MQNVAGAYSRRVNGQQQRSGTLWEGRFSASPVDTEYYCLACYRYIELNPVRAGMAASPADYRWSSYHENIGRRSLSIVEPHPCFEALGPTPQERAARYRSLVHEHLPDKTVSAIRLGTNKNLPVGQQDFVQAIERSVGIRFGARDRGRPRAAD